MAFKANIPAAGDLLSQSQADILNNFTALNAVLNVNLGVLNLPINATAPTTLANTPAIYSKLNSSSVPALFWRQQSSGTEVDFTTAVLSATGWCTLPCGLIMQWGTDSLGATVASVPVSFAKSFTTLLGVILTVTNAASGDARDAIVAAASATITGFSAERNSSYKGSVVGFNWLAIGI